MGFGKLDGAAHWWSGNDDFRYEFLTGGAPIEAAIRQRIVGTLNLGFLVAIVLGDVLNEVDYNLDELYEHDYHDVANEMTE
ncbi:hypothetical protein HPP92_026513 [Vanilla planifolia]|uniref:Uncharacterized protein n=1 Tax=Vanilla planifolia TaxID=51239 RepID=A0A835U7L0_VANPL|nr:hypothetical protein HPP92_026513 [Vanilla planifolia]